MTDLVDFILELDKNKIVKADTVSCNLAYNGEMKAITDYEYMYNQIVELAKKMKPTINENNLVELVLEKAYKGYVHYNTEVDRSADYYNFEEFKKMENGEILFCFMVYIERVAKIGKLKSNPFDSISLEKYYEFYLFD
jgi:hypothetical protein